MVGGEKEDGPTVTKASPFPVPNFSRGEEVDGYPFPPSQSVGGHCLTPSTGWVRPRRLGYQVHGGR